MRTDCYVSNRPAWSHCFPVCCICLSSRRTVHTRWRLPADNGHPHWSHCARF